MENFLFRRPCPLCGAEQGWLIRPLRYALFDDLGLSGISPLVACSSCGFVFNDLSEGSEALAAYYSGNDHYSVSTTAGSGGSTPIECARYERWLERLDEWLDPTQTILDVGCGKAGLLLYLRDRGYRSLFGLEASNACRDVVGNIAGLSVVERIEQLPEAPAVVVISHVLEHLYDPLSFLREIVSASDPDAIFYIEVPNTAVLLDAVIPWSWLYFEHINHFDRSHLLAMIQKAGLAPMAIDTWSFQPSEGSEMDCLYVLCQRGENVENNIPDTGLAMYLANGLPIQPVSEAQIAEILSTNRDFLLWGLSQYAMLILGMHPEILERLKGLFDASSAKVGRKVCGIEVLNAKSLLQCLADQFLLLPQSTYTESMIESLKKISKNCQYFVV